MHQPPPPVEARDFCTCQYVEVAPWLPIDLLLMCLIELAYVGAETMPENKIGQVPYSVDATYSGIKDTDLHVLCGAGSAEAIRNHLESTGADVDATGAFGFTPLFWAAQAGNTPVVHVLLQVQ